MVCPKAVSPGLHRLIVDQMPRIRIGQALQGQAAAPCSTGRIPGVGLAPEKLLPLGVGRDDVHELQCSRVDAWPQGDQIREHFGFNVVCRPSRPWGGCSVNRGDGNSRSLGADRFAPIEVNQGGDSRNQSFVQLAECGQSASAAKHPADEIVVCSTTS